MAANAIAVQAALRLLTESLQPHIEGLSPRIWRRIAMDGLTARVGQDPGPKVYSATDVQCQLRIITERLGSLGYPFSEGTCSAG